jgi:hypothetical protein
MGLGSRDASRRWPGRQRDGRWFFAECQSNLSRERNLFATREPAKPARQSGRRLGQAIGCSAWLNIQHSAAGNRVRQFGKSGIVLTLLWQLLGALFSA